MRLGSPSSAARHRYTQRVLNSVHVPLRVPFVSVLPPRRLLHVKFKTRHVVFQPTAAQRTAVAADEVPGPNEGFPSEYFGNTRPSQPRRAALASALGVLPSPLDKLENAVKILNTMTNLLGVIALLILLPAWLACKCIPARAWQAAALYYVSFGFGVLQSALKYGKAAGSSWKHDAHLSTWQGKRAITLFVLLVIAGTVHVTLYVNIHPYSVTTCRTIFYSKELSSQCTTYIFDNVCIAWHGVQGTQGKSVAQDIGQPSFGMELVYKAAA